MNNNEKGLDVLGNHLNQGMDIEIAENAFGMILS
jgi:hypothetical protein